MPLSASASGPVTEALSYRAYIGGLPLGTLNLKIQLDENRYSTEAKFDVGGWLNWALDTDARASSNGSLDAGTPVRAEFRYWVRDGKKERNTQMLFDASGNPSEVRANPVFR